MTDGNPCGYMRRAKSGEKYRFWDLADLSTHKRALLGQQIWIKGFGMILLAQFENESGQLPANFNTEFPCSISLCSEFTIS